MLQGIEGMKVESGVRDNVSAFLRLAEEQGEREAYGYIVISPACRDIDKTLRTAVPLPL